MASIEDLKGQVIAKIDGLRVGSEGVDFILRNGQRYEMSHAPDCCETVEIIDVIGDVSNLIGTPILMARESNSESTPELVDPRMEEKAESFTWTFYTLATIKGYVDIRWFGSSNGHYSETVDFKHIL